MDSNSNYALATALKQAGVHPQGGVFATGYEPDVINSPAWSALQGDYFSRSSVPGCMPDAGTEQMQAAMEKYAHFTKTDFPSFSQYEAWAGADLMIKGLERAGSNPTQASRDPRPAEHQVLQRQRAAAAEPSTTRPSSGTTRRRPCTWVIQATKTGFKMAAPKPLCGTDIPGTATASS